VLTGVAGGDRNAVNGTPAGDGRVMKLVVCERVDGLCAAATAAAAAFAAFAAPFVGFDGGFRMPRRARALAAKYIRMYTNTIIHDGM